jgi:uncharacterized protein YdeI (BOF family)
MARRSVGPPLAIAVTAWLAATVAAAADDTVTRARKDPYRQPDGTWISLSGTVKRVEPDAFVLEFHQGTVTVEMDDGDRDADAYALLEGDRVTVSGRIDDDFFETTTIEASSVYVEKLATAFYASAEDEEDARRFLGVSTPIAVSTVLVRGTVTAIADDGFTLDTGDRRLEVAVGAMPHDPLDDEGDLRIGLGDAVQVTGVLDRDLFADRRLLARAIVELQ